jgi:hypothetical protein
MAAVPSVDNALITCGTIVEILVIIKSTNPEIRF